LVGKDPRFACIECGDLIAPSLAGLGALRCHDCSDGARLRML
jgi:hypothetical protein